MLIEEAIWINNTIKEYFSEENFPLLNIGSSTFEFRSKVQPQIHNIVFLPLLNEGKKVIHSDIKIDEGVDLVGDLNDEEFRLKLKALGVNSVLCSNLLEHLSNPALICESIIDVLPPGGFIIVTVPYFFPYHKDPIDNMLRPDVNGLFSFFPNTNLIESAIVETNSSLKTVFMANKKYLARMIMRYAVPFYKFDEWAKMVKDIFKLNKKFSVTCILIQKKESAID